MRSLEPERFYDRWLRRPQSTWLRRAVFQIHLWSGLVLGLYIVVVCASGSAIVFRNDFYDILLAKLHVTGAGARLGKTELAQAVARTHPGYQVESIRPGRDSEEASEVTLVSINDNADAKNGGFLRTWNSKRRLVDPYTGDDKGPAISQWFRLLVWISDLHGRLLLGNNGMTVNAIGGGLTALVSFTGLVIWWPGMGRVRRAMMVRWRVKSPRMDRDSDPDSGSRAGYTVGWKRWNYDLHSAVGFWTFALLFVWGVTGFYFVYPQPFRAAIEYFTPIFPPPLPSAQVQSGGTSSAPAASSPKGAVAGSTSPSSAMITITPPRRRRRPLTLGGKILRDFSYAHYGNFAGWPVQALWVVLGFAPVVLFGSALVMWWNRVLSPARRRWLRSPVEAPLPEGLPEMLPEVLPQVLQGDAKLES
jgi:uncharacterized iron-regulated membrane protein